ncbi:FG-GAP repeat-containing protein [Candidatus Magnetobacterium bavaricum]|uniref:FG-GAP repeat-containing protein n=1 Tax=Candidatus Magnetobacterium bavaricum TaxID=29290 RepID=A0A0F3GTH6_9BACT|nr:FG-GAP repeat-containing protein [Candidatus Magnetobacterium bavaricum]
MAMRVFLLLVMLTVAWLIFPGLSEKAYAVTVNLSRTGQTKVYAQRDDGAIKAGVIWPDPRFNINTNGTVTDALTGLVWSREACTPTAGTCTGSDRSWQTALEYISCLNGANYLGYNDWRMANVNELESLTNAQESVQSTWLSAKGFNNVRNDNYWSSTTSASDTSHAWVVSAVDGVIHTGVKEIGLCVWPVRSGGSGAFGDALPWSTGQTATYAAGDDGALRSGATWPTPRFTDANDGTVADNLTGLVWSKDANTPVTGTCTGSDRSWQAALEYVSCLNGANYLGYNDWRLPNKKELMSLVDRGRVNPAIASGNPFTNVNANNYWSSSTTAYDSYVAWLVDINGGSVWVNSKSYGYRVWPVRGGRVYKGAPDFNGDGNGDVLWRDTATGDIAMWLMNGAAITDGNYVTKGVPADWEIKAKGDFNGDGKSDVLWQNVDTGAVYIWLMDGISIIGGDFAANAMPKEWQIRVIGDFNGDGKSDVLWQNTSTGDTFIWLMNGARIKGGDFPAKGIPPEWETRAAADLNGDGKTDVLWQNTQTGDVAGWLMNGTSISSGNYLTKAVPGNWKLKVAEDLNADGEADVLWQDSASGDVYIWLMNGLDIAGGGYIARGIPSNWQIKTTGDYNGDGRTDILWQDTANGDVYIWLMNGISISGGDYPAKGIPNNWLPK